jgi:hypothetical protein
MLIGLNVGKLSVGQNVTVQKESDTWVGKIVAIASFGFTVEVNRTNTSDVLKTFLWGENGVVSDDYGN